MSEVVAVFDRLPGLLEVVMVGGGVVCSVKLTDDRPTWSVPEFLHGRDALVTYRPQPRTHDEVGLKRTWRVRL